MHRPSPGDAPIRDLKTAGVKAPSRLRLKLFTINNRFIARRIVALEGPIGGPFRHTCVKCVPVAARTT